MLEHHHDLGHEFPDLRNALHLLKTTDEEFRGQLERYVHLDKTIFRSEAGIEPHSDDLLEVLKRERVALKDLLFDALRQADEPATEERQTA